MLTMLNYLAALTPSLDLPPRFDLLEGLLRPLEQLPSKDQFFAFLTTEDDRVVPVSGLAYNAVMLSPYHVNAHLEHASCKVLCTRILCIGTYLTIIFCIAG